MQRILAGVGTRTRFPLLMLQHCSLQKNFAVVPSVLVKADVIVFSTLPKPDAFELVTLRRIDDRWHRCGGAYKLPFAVSRLKPVAGKLDDAVDFNSV